MLTKITLALVMLAAVGFALLLYHGRVQTVDPELQRQIEANIPECVERNRTAGALTKKMKEQNRTYYFLDELDDYDRKAKACSAKFQKAYAQKVL